jgi:2-keto-4-pentenoate hydratase
MARRTGGPAVLDAAEPQSPAQAFAVQDAVLAKLEEAVGGWKASGESPEGFPLIAPLHASTLRSDTTRPAPADGWSIEVELAFCLGSEMAPGALSDAVAEVRVCLELCRSRVPAQAARLLFLADGLANDGVVLGSGRPAGPALSLAGRQVHLRINGQPVYSGTTGSQAEMVRTLDWFARQPRGGGDVRPGQVIITGSLSGLTKVAPGDVVEASIDGVGAVRFTPT